jgi:hypothetical protein
MAKSQVTLDPTKIVITREPVASNSPELLLKDQIVSVFPCFNERPAPTAYADNSGGWGYRFNTMTHITFTLADGSKVELELQEVTNQPTWNLGTQTALNNAMTDINAWL